VKYAIRFSADNQTDWAEAAEDLGRQVAAQLGPAKTRTGGAVRPPKIAPQIDGSVRGGAKGGGARHIIGCTGR